MKLRTHTQLRLIVHFQSRVSVSFLYLHYTKFNESDGVQITSIVPRLQYQMRFSLFVKIEISSVRANSTNQMECACIYHGKLSTTKLSFNLCSCALSLRLLFHQVLHTVSSSPYSIKLNFAILMKSRHNASLPHKHSHHINIFINVRAWQSFMLNFVTWRELLNNLWWKRHSKSSTEFFDALFGTAQVNYCVVFISFCLLVLCHYLMGNARGHVIDTANCSI